MNAGLVLLSSVLSTLGKKGSCFCVRFQKMNSVKYKTLCI